ncbi:uncharacterized protein [Hyperolius riggenbachi]|uniref:uncharacterized protein n=1 Tax=Hyperolius riggenbachi TaxID=752182 RepID=UPI0035A2D8E3
MDPSSHKFYHKHEPDSRESLETYYSGDPDTTFKDDLLKFPVEKMHNAFSMGHMTGNLLIDISAGPIIHHLYSACEFFKEIILMRTNEQCIMEIMKWHDDRTGAFCWGHTAAHVTDLEGTSDQCEAKEMRLKSAITHVVKFDPETESLTDLIGVPQADCIITSFLLDVISKDEEDYVRNLRKILELLKPGGHLVLLGARHTSYYTVGGHKYHVFRYDETCKSKHLYKQQTAAVRVTEAHCHYWTFLSAYLETYFCGHPDMAFKDDTLSYPLEKLHNAFDMGHITGKILIDISAGPLIHLLYSACKFFQEIILMRTNEKCIMEIMKWLDDRTGAFCWGHVAKHVTDLEGKSHECEAKEMKLKSAITRVVKFDPESEDLTDPIGVPQADCILTAVLLDKICKDQDDYRRNLRKILKLLKPGGHLILIGTINASYYTVGVHRFHSFTYDENFVSSTLVAEGMTILQCEVTPRTSESLLITIRNTVVFCSSRLANRSRLKVKY